MRKPKPSSNGSGRSTLPFPPTSSIKQVEANPARVEAEQLWINSRCQTIDQIAGRMRQIAYASYKDEAFDLPSGSKGYAKDLTTAQHLLVFADAIQGANNTQIDCIAQSLREAADRLGNNIHGLQDLLLALADDLTVLNCSKLTSDIPKYFSAPTATYTQEQVEYLLKEEFRRGFDVGFRSAFREE